MTETKLQIAARVQRLRGHDRAYEAGTPRVSDDRYDRERATLAQLDPHNAYLAQVRDTVADTSRKEPMPIIVGSADKLRPKDVAAWMARIQKTGGRQRGWLVEPKFDGQSVTLMYDGGKLTKAWTRGKIERGRSMGQRCLSAAVHVQGVLRSLRTLDCVDFMQPGEQVLVRGEVVMHQELWTKVYASRTSEDGDTGELTRTYKNPRNMCAGLLNRKDPSGVVPHLKRCTFVALQLFRKVKSGRWVRPNSAHAEWVMLELLGFTTALNPTRYTLGHRKIEQLVRSGHECLRSVLPVHDPHAGIGSLAYWDHHPTESEVVERLSSMRAAVDIRIDGLVVQPIDATSWIKRGQHLAPRPEHVMSIKLEAHDQDHVDGVVKRIEGRISKRGVLCPRVILREALHFDGVDVTYATVNNYRHVERWGLRPGRPIRMVRSGDVIPRVIGVRDGGKWHVVAKHDGVATGTVIRDAKVRATLPTHCPDCDNELQWDRNEVRLWCDNVTCPGRLSKSVSSFFRILGVRDVASGTIAKLIDAGLDTVPKLLANASPEWLIKIEGFQDKKAKIISKAIFGALKGAPLHKIMHASGVFSDEVSSLGSTKLYNVIEHIGTGMVERASDVELRSKLAHLRDFGPGGMKLFLGGLPRWRKLWERIRVHHVASTGPQTLKDAVVAFTNFRDADMQSYIEQHGGRVAGLSKKTTVLFSGGGVSGKTKKADALRIEIVPQLEAWAWLRKRAGDET